MATRPTAIILARCASRPESRLIRSNTASVHAFGGHLHLRRDLRFGHVVVLEDQPVALAVVLDEVEEGLHGGRASRCRLSVVVRSACRTPETRLSTCRCSDGEVELQLRREVLVENGFAYARTVGDLVHAGGVVAAVDENLAGSDRATARGVRRGAAGCRADPRPRDAGRPRHRRRVRHLSLRRRWRDRSSRPQSCLAYAFRNDGLLPLAAGARRRGSHDGAGRGCGILVRWRAREVARRTGRGLCHPVSVTYDPERRREAVACPCCATKWRRAAARAARPAGGRAPAGARSNRDEHRQRCASRPWLGHFVSTYGWRAYALPVLIALTASSSTRPSPGTSAPAPNAGRRGRCRGPPTIGVASTQIIGAPPKGLDAVRREPADRASCPTAGRSREAGAKTWHIVPGTSPKVGEGTAKVFTYTVEVEDGVDTTTFGGDDGVRPDGQRDAGQPKELDAQPAVRVHRAIDSGRARLPGVAELADDGARRLRLRHPARGVLLQPGLHRRVSPACSSTRPAGCAARCRSRATSARTGST